MKPLTTYLHFDGTARDAMTFYKECIGGELTLQTFGDVGTMDDDKKDRIMHGQLTNGDAVLMGADTMPGKPFGQGNNFSITINCSSAEEQDMHFAALGEGGKVNVPLQDTFWGARFGELTDKFGVQWMLNFDKSTPR